MNTAIGEVVLAVRTRYRNVDLLSIGYAFRPRLRPDSPHADRRCVGNLGNSAGRVLTCLVVTHANSRTSERSTLALAQASLLLRTFLYCVAA